MYDDARTSHHDVDAKKKNDIVDFGRQQWLLLRALL